MIKPRVAGQFAFPGVAHFVDTEAESLGMTREDSAQAIDGAHRSAHVRAAAQNISGAASTHDPSAVESILAHGEAIFKAMVLEINAVGAAYDAAYEAAGLEYPKWLGRMGGHQTQVAENEARERKAHQQRIAEDVRLAEIAEAKRQADEEAAQAKADDEAKAKAESDRKAKEAAEAGAQRFNDEQAAKTAQNPPQTSPEPSQAVPLGILPGAAPIVSEASEGASQASSKKPKK